MRLSLFTLLTLPIFIISCNSAKKTTSVQEKAAFTDMLIIDGCPSKGNCTTKIMKNTSMVFKIEKSTGMLYPKFEKDSLVDVIKIVYEKNVDKRIADASYSEHVYFEIPKGTKELSLLDKELSTINFIYGRFCYCKGAAGYFKVNKGNFEMKDGKINFNFQNENVHQVLEGFSLSY